MDLFFLANNGLNKSVFRHVFLLLFLFIAFPASSQKTSLADIANPLVGTKGVWLFGRTTPFVTPPFGMTHWTACTRQSIIHIPNYQYYDRTITGFRGTHKPAMWMGDYGHVTLKPSSINLLKTNTVDALQKRWKQKLHFKHCEEISRPYYYSVKLRTKQFQKIKTEMTATERCGVLHFEFEGKENPLLFIETSQLPDSNGWVKIIPDKKQIVGWNSDRQSAHLGPPLPHFKGYFVIQFDEAFESYGVWNGDNLKADSVEQMANSCGAWVIFNANTKSVQVKVATSFISLEQANENFAKEVADKSFAQIKNETQVQWNTYLNRIEIEAANKKQAGTFYSAMYHSLLFPRQFSEYGRYYSAFDDTIHAGVSYNDYSLWDTYRAQHPLLTLVAPEHVPGMVQSLVQMYEQGGYMPKWPNPTYTGIMIGTHADAVVADAVAKGVKGFDYEKAYKACMKDAMVPSQGDSTNRWADRALWTAVEARAGLSWYMKLGYVPDDKTNESVSNTLEGAYDDFCVAQVAKATGHLNEYEMLMKRSKNYVNVYNEATGFMSPKNADGTWSKNTRSGFTEGGPWTYLFAVQQDIPGLIKLLGGRETFVKRLNANFRWLRYWHENEPGHHYTYLYDYAGEAWRTQKKVAHFRTIKYHNRPHGLTGDDDCGQMSAWYIFSALGFYPVTPGTDIYAIGTPLFPKATIHFGEKNFEILARHVSKKNIYIQSVSLNGKVLSEPFLHHAEIINGGKLEFEMGPKPKKEW